MNKIDQEIARLEGLEKSLAAFAVGAGQGLTYGGSDEAAASLGSLIRGTPIAEEQAMQEQIRAGAATQNPAAYTTGQIAGAVFSPINKVIGAGANAIKGFNTVGRGVTAAAAAGGLGGFLSGEGGADERVDDLVKGGVTGAGIDLALRGAGRVVKDVGRQVGRTFGLANPEQVAAEKISTALSRGGKTVEDVAEGLQDTRNLPLNVAGRDAIGLADDVINRPSAAQSAAIDALEAQRTSAKDVALRAMQENLDDAAKYGDEVAAVKNKLKQIGEEQYNKIVVPTTKVKSTDVLKDPVVAQYIKNVEADPALGFDAAARDTLPYLHKLQSIMGEQAQGLRTALDPALRDRARASGIEGARRKIIAAIEEIEPKYATARKQFAETSQLDEAIQAGREFMRGEADDVITQFKELPKQAQDLFRLSAAKELGIQIEKKGFASQANKLMKGGDEDFRRRLKTLFPSAESFNAFVDRVKTEKGRFDTAGRILGGSQTFSRQTRAADTDTIDQALTAFNGGVSGTIRNLMGRAALPEKYVAQITKDLTAQGPEAQQQLIERLLRERAARQAAAQQSILRSAATGGFVGQEFNRRKQD